MQARRAVAARRRRVAEVGAVISPSDTARRIAVPFRASLLIEIASITVGTLLANDLSSD